MRSVRDTAISVSWDEPLPGWSWLKSPMTAARVELVKEPYDDNKQDYERKAAGPASSAGAAPAGETPVEYRTAPPSAGSAEMRSAEVRTAGAGTARTSAAESAAGAPAKRLPSGMSSSAV